MRQLQNLPDQQTDFFRVTVQRKGSQALVSYAIEARNPGDILKLNYHNRYLTKGNMIIDRVLVYAARDEILIHDGADLLLDNEKVYGHP